VERALEQWLAQAPTAVAAPLDQLPAVCPGPLRLFDRPGALQSNIRMARLAPSRADPWWPAAALANLIFGGMFSSRLVANLRERNGFCYTPRTSFDHGRAGSSFVIQADVATSSTAAALVEIRYELGRIATQGVTEEEFESARRYALGSLSFMTATQAGFASTLANLAIMGLDRGYLGRYAAALKRAKRHEVDEAARRLLGPSQMVTVVLGDTDLVGGSLSVVADVQRSALSAPR
jgi:predicted Zn-dependent peptidase